MNNLEAIFYDLPDGTFPAMDFVDSLPVKLSAKTYRTIELLEEKGTSLREPSCKHLEDGIFELRTELGSDITRVLFFFIIGNRAVLTNGFLKKTQKTPRTEIEKAKKYRNEYLNREI